MKKIFLALALMLCLTACTPKANDANANSKSNSQGQTQDTGKKKVTATTSFLYDMTKTLAGDFVDVDLIIPAGEDPHPVSYTHLTLPTKLEWCRSRWSPYH